MVGVLGNQSPKKKILMINFNKLKEITYNLHLKFLNSDALAMTRTLPTGFQCSVP